MKPGSWRAAARHTSPLPRRSRWRARLVVEVLEERTLMTASGAFVDAVDVYLLTAPAEAGPAKAQFSQAILAPQSQVALSAVSEAEPNGTTATAPPVTVPTADILTAGPGSWLAVDAAI